MNPTPLAYFRRFALTALTAGAVVLAGCQSAEQAADTSVKEQFAEAQQAADAGQLTKAISDIDAIAGTTGLSAGMSAEIHSLQGHLHLLKANQSLDQAASVDLNVTRLLGELRLSTLRVQSIQGQVKSDQGYDPAQSIAKLNSRIADATGAPGKENWNGDLLTLAGIDGESKRLAQLIQENESQFAAHAASKTSLAEQADALMQKSLKESGQQSVDDATAAAELNRRAADDSIDCEKLQVTMANLSADLARIKGQRAGVEKAISDFKQQISGLELAWRGVQQDMEAQNRAIAVMAGPAATPPAAGQESDDIPRPMTIADQCTQLKSLITASRSDRETAAGELGKAKLAYAAAARAGEDLRLSYATALSSDRTTPTEKASIQRLDETYAGASYNLAAFDAQRLLAMNYASEALIALQARQALGAAISTLGSAAPAAIAECQTAIATPSIDDFTQLAEDQFKDVFDNYDRLSNQPLPGTPTASRKIAAKVGKMLAVYSAKQLSLALQNKPIGGQTPKEMQDTINDLAKEVSDADPSRLPAIPYTIAATPAAQ